MHVLAQSHWPRSNPVFLLSSPPHHPFWLFESCLQLSFWDSRVWRGKLGYVVCHQFCLSDFQWDKEATPKVLFELGSHAVSSAGGGQAGAPWKLFLLDVPGGGTAKYINHCQVWVQSISRNCCVTQVFSFAGMLCAVHSRHALKWLQAS